MERARVAGGGRRGRVVRGRLGWGGSEKLLLTHEKTPGFLASGGEEFNLGPETRLDRSELL